MASINGAFHKFLDIYHSKHTLYNIICCAEHRKKDFFAS